MLQYCTYQVISSIDTPYQERRVNHITFYPIVCVSFGLQMTRIPVIFRIRVHVYLVFSTLKFEDN